MPDRRRHRGAAPGDERRFAEEALGALRAAVADLSLLKSRAYSAVAALELVGNRYALCARQRIAVGRCACSDAALASRRASRAAREELRGTSIDIDGYNVLTTVEAALAGGVLLGGRDGFLRDMASMHGSWRRVDETERAIDLVAEALAALGAGRALWLLDAPVSNSGRLAAALRAKAERDSLAWTCELVADPDSLLAVAPSCVATADSGILDRCTSSFDLAREVVSRSVPSAWLVDFASASAQGSKR